MPAVPRDSRSRLMLRAPLAFLIACLLAGVSCKGSDSGDASPTPSPIATLAPTPTTTPTATPEPVGDGDAAARAAIDALAIWLGPVGDRSAITLRSVEAVTWRNGCLELNRAGRFCTEALVDGFRVELALGNATFEVRTDARASVVLWAPRVQILARFAAASPNFVRLTTDDGGTIEAQTVFGSDFSVEVATLTAGDAVGVALADAPQSGGLLLVWLDPVPD